MCSYNEGQKYAKVRLIYDDVVAKVRYVARNLDWWIDGSHRGKGAKCKLCKVLANLVSYLVMDLPCRTRVGSGYHSKFGQRFDADDSP